MNGQNGHHFRRLRIAFSDMIGTTISMLPYVPATVQVDREKAQAVFTVYIQTRKGTEPRTVNVGMKDDEPDYDTAARKILILA